MTMKLMSWNVGRKDKVREQLDAIVSIKIDILALQEVTLNNFEGFRESLPKIGLTHIAPKQTSRQGHSVLIASRWPMKPIKMIEVPRKESTLSVIIGSHYGEIELHTVHVPNASKNGRQTKVDTLNGIYKRLSKNSDRHRILCGDFNSPKKESLNGTVMYFGLKYGQKSEEQVLSGLSEYDLADTYIELHGYTTLEYSHVNNKKTKDGERPKRRFDHIFSSKSLNPKKCCYLHDFRESDLSDHSPIYAAYEPKILRLPIKK